MSYKDKRILILVLLIVVSFGLYYFTNTHQNKSDPSDWNEDFAVFIDERPSVDLSNFNCDVSAAKKAQCLASGYMKLRKQEQKNINTLYEFREFLRFPDRFEKSTFACKDLRGKFISIASKVYDTPKENAIIYSSKHGLVFNFRHPYFSLPGNDTLPKKYSSQNTINEEQEAYDTFDLKPGSSAYFLKSEGVFEMGMIANLFPSIVYLYNDHLNKIEINLPRKCK
jgi:hypothetical protein